MKCGHTVFDNINHDHIKRLPLFSHAYIDSHCRRSNGENVIKSSGLLHDFVVDEHLLEGEEVSEGEQHLEHLALQLRLPQLEL